MLVQNAITSIIDDNEDDGEDDDDNDDDDDDQFFIKKKTRVFISYHIWLAKICSKWLFMPLFLTMLWLSGSPKWKQLIISNNYSWIYAIDTNGKKNVAISENNNIIKILLEAFVPKCPLTWYFNWVACEGNAQSKNGLYLYWTNLPEGFACPIPPSKRPSIFAGSGRVISSHLADSKARSFWPYIYAEWLSKNSIWWWSYT